jgi:hypothetical protein
MEIDKEDVEFAVSLAVDIAMLVITAKGNKKKGGDKKKKPKKKKPSRKNRRDKQK